MPLKNCVFWILMQDNFMKFVFGFFITALSHIAFAQPSAQPVMKNGSCPSGYTSSGDYCLSSK